MTKVDRTNYFKKEELPSEYNDAHAALRGYANSDLSSSVIFSAGMNPRLYGYIAKFNDFFPDKNGNRFFSSINIFSVVDPPIKTNSKSGFACIIDGLIKPFASVLN